MTKGEAGNRMAFRVAAAALVLGSVAAVAAFGVYRARLAQAERALDEALAREETLGRLVPEDGRPGHLIDGYEIERLQEAGLTDPIRDLVADLITHPELIPHEAILGGKMGFYDSSDIHVLSERWILAGFEDGHIAGRALLAFRIEGGRITWEVVASYVEE